MSDPTALLKLLAENSERKLREPRNVTKGDYRNLRDWELRQAIRDEVVELLIEIGVEPTPLSLNPDPNFKVDWRRVLDEGGDVYHYTGMGADPERLRRQHGCECGYGPHPGTACRPEDG